LEQVESVALRIECLNKKGTPWDKAILCLLARMSKIEGGGENEGGQLFDMGVYNRREWFQM